MPDESPEISAAPAPLARAAVATAIGLACGLLAAWLHARAGFWPDFVFPWTAAGQLRTGIDPYQALPGGLMEPFETPLLYPLTTVLASLPVSWLPLAAGGGVAMGLSAALLAWVLTARGFDRLWVLVSAPFVMAINLGQWSPLVMTAALVPAAGWLATLKPNIGLAVFIWRPSWRFAVSAALFGAVSVAVLPRWPLEWLVAVRSLPGHPAPFLAAGGVGLLLLLAVIRWRTPAARLLLAMAFVPQLLLFADQLPLWLIARSKREVQLLSTLSMIGFMGWIAFLPPGRPEALRAQPWVMAFVYLPALVLVLWRRKGAGAATDHGWLVPDDQGSATRKATRAESPPAIVTTTESG